MCPNKLLFCNPMSAIAWLIFTFLVMCYATKYFVKGFCDLRRPPRIVLTFQKQYVSLRFLDQYFSALATNISAKTILGGGILQFPAGPKSSEPIFVGFSTASHQREQNVAAWQEMKVQVATNTNTDTNTLSNTNIKVLHDDYDSCLYCKQRLLYIWILFRRVLSIHTNPFQALWSRQEKHK